MCYRLKDIIIALDSLRICEGLLSIWPNFIDLGLRGWLMGSYILTYRIERNRFILTIARVHKSLVIKRGVPQDSILRPFLFIYTLY